MWETSIDLIQECKVPLEFLEETELPDDSTVKSGLLWVNVLHDLKPDLDRQHRHFGSLAPLTIALYACDLSFRSSVSNITVKSQQVGTNHVSWLNAAQMLSGMAK
jgi:hypothetical protein